MAIAIPEPQAVVLVCIGLTPDQDDYATSYAKVTSRERRDSPLADNLALNAHMIH